MKNFRPSPSDVPVEGKKWRKHLSQINNSEYIAGTSERLGIWYTYSIKTIVFKQYYFQTIVYEQYVICFEQNVGNFCQAMAVLVLPLPTALHRSKERMEKSKMSHCTTIHMFLQLESWRLNPI